MGGGVVAGVGPLRLQQSAQECEPIRFVRYGRERAGEQGGDRLFRGEKPQRQHNDRHARHVIPRAKIVQTRDRSDPDMIEDRMGEQKNSKDHNEMDRGLWQSE